jgi:hypothetical protein
VLSTQGRATLVRPTALRSLVVLGVEGGRQRSWLQAPRKAAARSDSTIVVQHIMKQT